MKTLLIILASLSSALSKPALLENHIHGFETTLNLPGFTLEKNVPLSKTHELRTVRDNRAEENIYANNEMLISPIEANSHRESESSEKIENGMGFRVYRKSDDTDTLNGSRGKCKKQVQLKFCEDESDIISQMRHENTIAKARLMTKDDMEERMKMAKEALEHLKKYLRVESSSKIKILDSEEELQNEQSQQEEHEVFHALVNNLGNLQSSSFNSVPNPNGKINDTKPEQNRLTNGDDTKMKQIDYDIEVISKVFDDYVTRLHDSKVDENVTKLAESRMDQWKHNIDEIQKDIVTGNNIEDRFIKERYNDDDMHFSAIASEKEDILSPFKSELKTDDYLDGKSNFNDEVHNEKKMLKNNEEHAENVMTQDINSDSNLHSDSLRLEAGAILVPESSELATKSDSISTEQHNVPKHNDPKSEYFENTDIGRTEHVEDLIFKEDSSGETKKNQLQERAEMKAESSVVKDAKNVLQNFKSMTDHSDESSNPNDTNLNQNLQNETTENSIEVRKSDAMTDPLITKNNDLNKVNNFEHENVQSFKITQERSEMNENLPNQEHTPLVAHKSSNTMKSDTSETSPFILTPPRETTGILENTSHFPFQSKINEDTNLAHEVDKVPNTPGWLAHTKNEEHMKNAEENKNEVTMPVLLNQNTQDLITPKTANDLGKINDPLLQNFNGHVNAQWAQVRDSDMVMPQTLPNVNVKQNFMRPGMHLDRSEMLRYDRINERNDVNGKENTQWMQRSSAHGNSGATTFEDQFHHMPAFRASYPGLNFKNSETNFLRPSDSTSTNERFIHDVTNLRDNSFSPVMAPIHLETMDSEDNMVQASERMRQFLQKSATDYAQSWYNRHGMARGSSYNQEQVNVPSSAGSGAVGLFPNANTGGCAIPLLVSCSPSVISGTLSKGQPSYSTHSYGSTDNYKYHKKREAKKTYDADVNKTNQIKMLKKRIKPATNKVEFFKSGNL